MPSSVKILLDRFQLFRVPSLPSLILTEISEPTTSQQQFSSASLVALIEDDVFLFSKVLGSFRPQEVNSPFDAEELLAGIGTERVEALISQAAMQCTFKEMSRPRLNFFKMHWRQSYLGKIIARELAMVLNLDNVEQAEFAGQFLNLGELVLEDLFTEQYRLLHETVHTETRQVEEERERLGFSHAEIGSELLRGWGFDSFVCDALHYHQEELEQVLDASTLVKLCWLTNLMATRPVAGATVFLAGARLFGLGEEQLTAIHASAMDQLKLKAEKIRLNFSSEIRLPLHNDEVEEVIRNDDDLMLELNEQVRNINLFNAVRSNFTKLSNSSASAKVGKVLGETLNLLFGFHECIVFCPDTEEKTLSVWVTSLTNNRVTELQIKCEEGRSVVADCYLNGFGKVSSEREKDMTVIDRQILSLLGKSDMVCDPVVIDDEVKAVLIMGIQQSQSSAYCKQGKIRDLLKAEILHCMLPVEDESAVSVGAFGKRAADAGYEQRISDTIHEVNNPLSIIKNYLQLLSIKQKDDASFLEDVNVIKSEIDRVSSLLANLKNNENVSEEEAGEVDANLVIENLSKVFAASMFDDQPISFDLNLASELPFISFKESAFKQIITNLIKNAIEAILQQGNKGHISIRTYGNIFLNGRHYIQVKITDDGPGISVEAMSKLFMPGYSTKGEDHTGSGLAIVKTLIESMGGQISCRSDEQGTSFSMLFLRKMQFHKRSQDRRSINRPTSLLGKVSEL